MDRNDAHLTELTWTLEVINSGQLISQFASVCEKRSNICFAQVECTAPDLLPLRAQYVRCLRSGLASTTHLRRLVLRGHSGLMYRNFTPNLDDQTVQLLVDALLCNRSVCELDLGANRITDRGACALARLVGARTTPLTRLHLRQNFICPPGLIALAQALRTSAGMEVLDVSEQLTHGRGGVVVLRSTAHVMALQRAIHDAIHRRNELLLPLPAFHSFLSRERARQLLLPLPVHNAGGAATAAVATAGGVAGVVSAGRVGLAGRYLLYLDRHRPGVLMLAVVPGGGGLRSASSSSTAACVSTSANASQAAAPMQVWHRPIYRLAYGFSFSHALLPDTLLGEPTPSPVRPSATAASSAALPRAQSRTRSHACAPSAETSPLELRALLPSLQDHCLWLVCSMPKLCDLALQHLPEELHEQLVSIRSLLPLWGVQQIPGEQRHAPTHELNEQAAQRQHLTSWRTFSSNTFLTDPIQHPSTAHTHIHPDSRGGGGVFAHSRHLSTDAGDAAPSDPGGSGGSSASAHHRHSARTDHSRRRSLDRPLISRTAHSLFSTSTTPASTFHIAHPRVFPTLKRLVQRNCSWIRTPTPHQQVFGSGEHPSPGATNTSPPSTSTESFLNPLP
jgi:hypothetical protein